MSGVAMKNPAQGIGFGRRLSGVPKSLGGPWLTVWETPEGAFNATLFIDALQANGPLMPGLPSRRRSPAAPVARGPRTEGGRFWGTRSASGARFAANWPEESALAR